MKRAVLTPLAIFVATCASAETGNGPGVSCHILPQDKQIIFDTMGGMAGNTESKRTLTTILGSIVTVTYLGQELHNGRPCVIAQVSIDSGDATTHTVCADRHGTWKEEG